MRPCVGGLGPRKLTLRSHQFGLKWLRIDGVKYVSLFYKSTYLKLHSLKISLNPGSNRYILGSQGGTHHLHSNWHVLNQGSGDAYTQWRRTC